MGFEVLSNQPEHGGIYLDGNAVSGRALRNSFSPILWDVVAWAEVISCSTQFSPSPVTQAAAAFTRQGGHQALEQHQSTPELQERAQALLDRVRQPPGAPSACQATLAVFS